MNSQVVVTGAGSMGLAIARRVAQDRTIMLADINQTTLDAAATLLTGECVLSIFRRHEGHRK
ncbi:hypothetical protein ACTXOW_14525, partial [Corynebacterium variabile]